MAARVPGRARLMPPGAAAIQELIDFQEGRLDVAVLDDAGIAELLRTSRRIAIIGASSRTWRPVHGVMTYLMAAGYDVVPVSPREKEIEGLRCYPTLGEAVAESGPVDIVDVFRRPEACPEHAREAVAAGVRCLWLQLGIVSAVAARIAREGGLAVVMDRCTKIDHARFVR